jgi:hypothetical protein
LLNQVGCSTADACTVKDVCKSTMEILSKNKEDVCYALIYLLEVMFNTSVCARVRGYAHMYAHMGLACMYAHMGLHVRAYVPMRLALYTYAHNCMYARTRNGACMYTHSRIACIFACTCTYVYVREVLIFFPSIFRIIILFCD